MPPKKSANKALAGGGVGAGPAIAARQKEAIAAANQIRKDFKNLKLQKSAKLFNDCIAKNKEFEAELKMVRLELLATIDGHEESAYEPKVQKFALKEILGLVDDIATLQPCWGHAAERCCTLLRVNAGDPQKGKDRCSHAINCIEQSRPTDDKVFLDVFSQDHEANLHRLLDFDCKEDVQYLVDRLHLAKFIAVHDLKKKNAEEQRCSQQKQQQRFQWRVGQQQLEREQQVGEQSDRMTGAQNSVPMQEHAVEGLEHGAPHHAMGDHNRESQMWSGAQSQHDEQQYHQKLELEQQQQQFQQQFPQFQQHVQSMRNQHGQMVQCFGQSTDDESGDTAVLNRLQTAVIKRRNVLVQLYKQGLRRPPKRSKAVNGSDDKDDEIRRKMIEQDIVRVKALQLCREAGQEPQVDQVVDDQNSKRAATVGSDTKSHSERLQRKLAAKKEALEQSDANGQDSADRALRFLQTLPPEERAEALCLPIKKLEAVFNSLQQAQMEQINPDMTVQNPPTDAIPSLLAAAEEHAKGHWLARSWTQGDFQRFVNRQEYLSILLTMIWRLLLHKCKNDVLSHWSQGSPEIEVQQDGSAGPGHSFVDFREALPWNSDAADALPDLSKRAGGRTLPKKGQASDEEVTLARMKRYLMSRVEHLPEELLKKMDIILMKDGVVMVPRAMDQNGFMDEETLTVEKGSSARSRTVINLKALDGDEDVVQVDLGGSNGVTEGNGIGGEGAQHVLSNGQGGQDASLDLRHRELHSLIAGHNSKDCLEKLALESFKLQVREELEDLQRYLSARVGSMLVVEENMPLDCERLLAKGCSSIDELTYFSKKYQPEQRAFPGGGPEGQEEIWFSMQDRIDGGLSFNLALLSETVRQTKLQASAAWERADAMESPEGSQGLPINSETRVFDFGPLVGEEGGNAFCSILHGECMTAWLASADQVLEQGESRPIEEVFDMYERCELQTRQLWNERLQEFTHRGLQWTATCRTLHQVRHIHRQVIQMRLRVRLILEGGLVQMQQNLGQFLTDVFHFTQVSRGTCHYLRQGLSDHATVVWYRLQDAFRHMDTVRDGQAERLVLAEILNNDPEVQRDIESKIANSRKIAAALDEQISQTTQLREKLEQFAREPESLPAGMEFEGMEPLRNFVYASLQLPPALCSLLNQIDAEASDIELLMKNLQSEQMEFDLFRDLEAVVDAGANSVIVTEAISGLALAVVRDELAERGRAEEEAKAKIEQDNQAKAAEEELLQEEKGKEEQERQKREKQAKKRDKEKVKKKKKKEELETKREEEEKAQKAVAEKDRQEAGEGGERGRGGEEIELWGEVYKVVDEEKAFMLSENGDHVIVGKRDNAEGDRLRARVSPCLAQGRFRWIVEEILERQKPPWDKEVNASKEELLQEEKRGEEQERQKREKAAKKREKDKEKKRKAKEEQEEKRAEEEKAKRAAEAEERRQAEALRLQEEEKAAAAYRHAREAEEQAVQRRKERVEEETLKKRMQEFARRRQELEEEEVERVNDIERRRKELEDEMRSLELNGLSEQRQPAGGQERKQRGEAPAAHSRAWDSNGAARQHGQGPGEQGSGVAAAVGPAQAGNKLKFFLYVELAQATRNFDASLRLGGGGFGTVFRARGLRGFPSRQEFAVKRLDPDSTQGKAEFDQEVQVLGSCRHESLLPLIGFSTDHQLLCLVFPLMQASVQDRMFPPDGRGVLGWVERVRACASAAKALLYLHMPDPAVGKPVILHRDIKPSNLLLDADGLVRLSDFGLARMHREGTKSHLTITQVGGTNGFIDPKYMQTGHCEPASDAYSLGVTVLVLLTGWAAFEPGEDTVYDRCDGREAGEVADPRAQWPADKAADMLRVGMGLADPRKRFRMTVAEALAVLRHTESDPDVDSVASERECLLCMALPRAVRLGCGHATYCRDCLAAALARPSPVCPHCSCPVVVDDIVMDDGIAVENTWVRPVQRPPG